MDRLKKTACALLAGMMLFAACASGCGGDRGTSAPAETTAVAATEPGTKASAGTPAFPAADTAAPETKTSESAPVQEETVPVETETEKAPAVTFTVTFDLNGGGEPVKTEVEEGCAAEKIADPAREGYLFIGWFGDAECTVSYDFSDPVSEERVVYAGWEEKTADSCVAVFYMNDGTQDVFTRIQFAQNKWIAKPEGTPSRDGFVFDGWYADPEGTAAFNFNPRYQEDQQIYAKWRQIYTLEAELTLVEGKPGYGYSGSSSGKNMIMADNTEHKTASNGFYVGWLYYNGASIDFEFESDREISDATLVFRLSGEYDPINVTGSDIIVDVNGKEYDFAFSIQDVYDLMEENTHGKRDFANYTCAAGVKIEEGYNMISLVINNNIKGSGGTMYASAPIVDCMYMYTAAGITPIEYPDNLSGK